MSHTTCTVVAIWPGCPLCSDFILCRRGKHNTEQVTSREGGVCFSASGKGEIVPTGNFTELQREKAVLRGRAAGVALLTVMVTP